MADHRKSFRPRRLAFDGRLLPRGRLIGAALALFGALNTPAVSQELGLKHGAESLAAGKYDAAVRQLSATVNDEKATPSQAAQALMLRGIAYRKAGQPAKAIVDLGAAIWLGLPSSDKVRALVNKGLAYKAAGLSGQGDALLTEARKASNSSTVDKLIAEDGGALVASADSDSVATDVGDQSSSGESIWSRLVPSFGSSTAEAPAPPPSAAEPAATRTAESAPSSGWNASVSNEESPPSSGSAVSRWFGSLTGDSAPAPAPPTPATSPEPAPTAAPPSAASWAANTETEKVVSNDGGGTAIGRWISRRTESAPSAPAAAPAASGGGYTVQLANSRSQAEAQALWKKVQRANGQLASAAPQIEKVDIGNFGTFYSLKIGPFATQAESTKLCNALKRNGTDCSVISPDGP